ncbi:hypothetical protein [Kitasatospora sp. NPDC059160]|uniref:hypothetical protein n=1 Tax=Kitasatospora sp. NPDC059160 TaxID=3346748 RepID=UPI003686F908
MLIREDPPMGRQKPGKPQKIRRITEDATAEGVTIGKPPVFQLRAQAAQIPGGGATIIMIQPVTVARTAEDGTLLSPDVTEFTARHNGARQLTVPITLDPVDPRWRARLRLTADGKNDLLIGVGEYTFYDGTMPIPDGWTDLVGVAGGTAMLVTGPIKTLADIDPILSSGRASQVTIPLDIVR